MSLVVVGYEKDFTFLPFGTMNNRLVYEPLTDRVDYIRKTNLDKKERFSLIPKFISSKSIKHIWLEKSSGLPLKKFKGNSQKFLMADKDEFYNSRQIDVTGIRLDSVNTPFSTLVINWGDPLDILRSAGDRLIEFGYVYIKTECALTTRDETFLTSNFFIKQKESVLDGFTSFRLVLPTLKIVTYNLHEESDNRDEDEDDTSETCLWIPNGSIIPIEIYKTKIDDGYLFLDKIDARINETVIFCNKKTMGMLKDCIKGIKTKNFVTTILNENFSLVHCKNRNFF
jgi:hypothetical protein